MKRYRTVLIFSAHPDDAVLVMGGTMAKLAEDGYQIINVVFSCTQQNIWWLRQVYTADMVMQECIKASALLGCRKTIFLATDKNSITQALKEPIRKLMWQYRPEKVFTHLPDEGREPEHRKVSKLVEELLAELSFEGEFFRYGLWTLDLRTKLLPQWIIDVSSHFTKKRYAVALFRSRPVRRFLVWPLSVLRAYKNGLRIKRKFAEMFYLTPV